MMKRTKVIVCIALSLMFMFTTFGYAALTDTLGISGTANYEVPEGLFIVDISPNGINSGSVTSMDYNEVSYIEYSTTVDSSISHIYSWRNQKAGSVTYKITVLNNTNHEYAYRGLYYQSGVDDNSYVSTRTGNSVLAVTTEFPDGTVVPPKESLVFYATYTLGKSLNANRNYDTLLNYQFGINVNSEEAARNAIHDKFLDILNTTVTYEQLVDVLDNKFDGSQEWTSNYVGNVGSATTDDSVAVNTLFAGQLQMIINGVVTPAHVLIKHENLDNNRNTGDDYVATNTNNGGRFYGYGCEMTLYLTTDPLTQANGRADVYVSVFTCNRDADGNIVGDWYQIGDSYKGTAPIVGYHGESGGTGSFITDQWLSSSANYAPTDAYQYSVGDNVTIKSLVQTFDQRAIDAFQSLLDDAKAMIEDTRYAGTGITDVEEAFASAAPYYTLDANGNPIADPDTLRVWLFPVMNELDRALGVAQDAIDRIEGQ